MMVRSRWLLIVIGIILIGVLFVALNQVRVAHGGKGLIRYIPNAAEVDVPAIMLPEERNALTARINSPEPKSAPAAPAAAPAPTAPAPECPPAPPCEPVAPCEIVLPLEPEAYAPPEPPPPPPKEWPLLGPQITDALLHALAAEDQTFLGYRPNDLVIGRVIDNRTNFQRGLFAAARAELKLIVGLVEPPEPAPVGRVRQALIDGNLEKWAFPSAEKTMVEGLAGLREMSGGLASGAIRVPASDRNLATILKANADLMADAHLRVITGRIGFFDNDDHFYYAQGMAAAARSSIDASAISFQTAITEAGVVDEIEVARECLWKASHMSPIMVTGGRDSDGGHLIVIAYYLVCAEDALRAATDKLPQAAPEQK